MTVCIVKDWKKIRAHSLSFLLGSWSNKKINILKKTTSFLAFKLHKGSGLQPLSGPPSVKIDYVMVVKNTTQQILHDWNFPCHFCWCYLPTVFIRFWLNFKFSLNFVFTHCKSFLRQLNGFFFLEIRLIFHEFLTAFCIVQACAIYFSHMSCLSAVSKLINILFETFSSICSLCIFVWACYPGRRPFIKRIEILQDFSDPQWSFSIQHFGTTLRNSCEHSMNIFSSTACSVQLVLFVVVLRSWAWAAKLRGREEHETE